MALAADDALASVHTCGALCFGLLAFTRLLRPFCILHFALCVSFALGSAYASIENPCNRL